MRVSRPYIKTDGGRREAGFLGETNDCVIVALAIATGEPYELWHALAKEYGRRHRCGMHTSDFLRSLNWKLNNHFFRRVPTRKLRAYDGTLLTPASFCLTFTKGTFIVGQRGHVAAVIDGDYYDHSPPAPRAAVQSVYEVKTLRPR